MLLSCNHTSRSAIWPCQRRHVHSDYVIFYVTSGIRPCRAHAQQQQQNKIQIEQMQAQADIAVMREKAAAEIQIMRERAAVEADLKRQEAELAAQLKMIGATQSTVTTPAQVSQ